MSNISQNSHSKKIIQEELVKTQDLFKKYQDIYSKIPTSEYNDTNKFLNENINIINKYDDLVSNVINNNYICYLDGWEKLLKLKESNINIYKLSTLLVDYQSKNMTKIDMQFKNNINIINKYYEVNSKIIRQYFENPRYTSLLGDGADNPLLFVNQLLIHMTKIFICSTIENIIKKILYDYFWNNTINNNSTSDIDLITLLDKIDYVFSDKIIDYLYETIPKILVKNSVNIFEDQQEEASNIIITVAEILNNLLDLLKASSPIELDDYTINLIKSTIVPYFDTITFKIINNWNVVIENIFIFHINHNNILKCFHEIL
jgi:hypothetical protein